MIAALYGKFGSTDLEAQTIQATQENTLKVAKGFHVKLLYSVPKDKQGSWVNLCTDPQGRLIVSDQYGGLFRVTPSTGEQEIKIEPIPVDIGEAQGLLWAFNSLYVVVNKGDKYASGLYRVRDTNGDDQLDSVESLRPLDGRSEHGPHAIVLSPDKQSLFVVCGNRTSLTELSSSRVPQVWDEDNLLPRPYGRGFMKGTPAPGGCIYQIDPDGKNWELVATGFRNEFDAAFNQRGDLFAYDADMEWDVNTPWYRPTRVCHVVSGAEFGWRNGGGKWPSYYPDSLPSVVDVGFGSPTGVTFGYSADFPKRYQQALFICDWSYGKMYAVHMRPQGASYVGELEEFISGTPLPLTDVVINPVDHAMYFTIGGRKVQSGLYRVTYEGPGAEQRPPPAGDVSARDLTDLRNKLEGLHLGDHPQAVDIAWRHLSSEDRFVRFAARIAIEHRPTNEWKDLAFQERASQPALTSLLALARQYQRPNKGSGEELDAPVPQYPVANSARHADHPRFMQSLNRIDWNSLNADQHLQLLRVYTLVFTRLGPPNDADRAEMISRFNKAFPSDRRELDFELAQLLVYLQAPTAAGKIVDLLVNSPTQEEQIGYAKSLRHLQVGWTDTSRRAYLEWFVRAQGFRGGASFALFVEYIKKDAVANLTEAEKKQYAAILSAKPTGISTAISFENRPVVREWRLGELSAAVKTGLKNNDFSHGRRMFSVAKCFACHRFDGEGGAVGPDLTSLAGRFSPRDILESIIDPSKTISDQYAAVQIVTGDGRIIVGRIVNLKGNDYRINTNMLEPGNLTVIRRDNIEEMGPSRVSMMPTGLLNTLKKHEILDLMAFLVSRGNPDHPMFQKQVNDTQKTSSNRVNAILNRHPSSNHEQIDTAVVEPQAIAAELLAAEKKKLERIVQQRHRRQTGKNNSSR
jgi:putative heme-binding domain-containing protein